MIDFIYNLLAHLVYLGHVPKGPVLGYSDEKGRHYEAECALCGKKVKYLEKRGQR